MISSDISKPFQGKSYLSHVKTIILLHWMEIIVEPDVICFLKICGRDPKTETMFIEPSLFLFFDFS